MATQTKEPKPSGDVHEQMFADWVYQIPGLLLMVGGVAAFALIAVL